MRKSNYVKFVAGLAIVAATIAWVAAAALESRHDSLKRSVITWADALGRHLPLLERLYTRWIPPPAPPAPAVLHETPSPPARAGTASPAATEPGDPIALSPTERDALAALGSRLRGRLVWSSNRLGNHELFLIELPDLRVRRLTNNPYVDFFSRFSPDGKRISFVRSRREWVSFREDSAWDLYVMNVDGSGERRLAEHAYYPMWTPDGSALVFLRDNTLVQLDLASGRERVFYDGSAEPTQGVIGDASLQQDGLLALTWRRRGRQRVGVLDRERSKFIALSSLNACQMTWTPDGKGFAWVGSHDGNGGNRIMRGNLGREGEEVLIDLPGKYSHEYFPRFSSDGQWLVWGAAAEGHEHDRADYEIFAWKIGTPWQSALRLTYSPANDQWPDLYVEK